MPEEKFCTAPMREQHDGADDGQRQQDAHAAAHQVDPEVADPVGAERVKPRISATATAMPTAAETKFCTASPAICTRWPIVDSPE